MITPTFKVVGERPPHLTLQVERDVMLVGRTNAAQLALPAAQVSKLHALIVRSPGGVYVRDLASTNGIEINGAPVREAELHDADVLRIGGYTLECEGGFNAPGANGTLEAPPAELEAQGKRFAFPQDGHTLLIGRRAGCDVQLEHPSVAPVHAIIFSKGGERYVHIFAPAETATLNGEPAHGKVLAADDELRIGEVTLRYVPQMSLEAETDAALTGEIEPEAQVEVEEMEVVDDEPAPMLEGEAPDVNAGEPVAEAEELDADEYSLAEVEVEPQSGAPGEADVEIESEEVAPVEAEDQPAAQDALEVEPVEPPVEAAPAPPAAPIPVEAPRPPEPLAATDATDDAPADDIGITPFDLGPVDDDAAADFVSGVAAEESPDMIIDFGAPEVDAPPPPHAIPPVEIDEMSVTFEEDDGLPPIPDIAPADKADDSADR